LDRAATDLVAFVRQIVGEYQLSTERHDLRVAADASALIGEWDRARLARVFGNLLSNAVKYSPAGGTIDITMTHERERTGDWAVVRVRDRGIGIPASEVGQIFDRFHRAENVQGRITGSGLGLWSAKYIVDQHGGTIDANSKEGVGTTITVRLPLG
jgi:signal transduction histidine kinase